jgi:DNA polymerase-4
MERIVLPDEDSVMNLPINIEPPEIMHIDLNSAFAMTEQQANPLLRGRPVGITNRLNDYAICIAASYEAKKLGIGLGTRQREGRWRAPNLVMLETDPAKYQYVHRQIKTIFESYSSVAYMKSIDEGVIDFRSMRGVLKGRSLEDIAREIKQRIHDEVGDYMTVNVGIGQNRWLAKVAAGFLKPDGLYTINRENLAVVYGLMQLTDLPYIASHNKVRLFEAGIYSPLDFFRASEVTLTRRVFQSVNGHHWYLKLRGYETEIEAAVRTVGRSYVLEHRTQDPAEIATLLYKAAVKISRRLRVHDLAARGLSMSFGYAGEPMGEGWERYHQRGGGWQGRRMYHTAVWRADQIYSRALDLFRESPPEQVLAVLSITSYAVEKVQRNQLALYETDDARRDRIENAINTINDKYGELVLAPASVKASKNPMKDKIPFGTVRYFDK